MGKQNRQKKMNFLLLCSLLLLVASSGFCRPSFSNNDVVCPASEDGFPVFLPHPSDCTKYYQCQEDWPILMECAPPLYFDPDLGVCNWPRSVDPTTPQAAPSTTEEVVDTTTVQPTSSDDTRRFRRSVNMAADKTSTAADETTTKADETTEPVK